MLQNLHWTNKQITTGAASGTIWKKVSPKNVSKLVQQAYKTHRMGLDEAKNLQTEIKGLYIKQKATAQAVIFTRQNRPGA